MHCDCDPVYSTHCSSDFLASPCSSKNGWGIDLSHSIHCPSTAVPPSQQDKAEGDEGGLFKKALVDALGELMAEMEEGEEEEEELVLKIGAKISGLTGMRATVFLAGYICMCTPSGFRMRIRFVSRVCAQGLSLTHNLSLNPKHTSSPLLFAAKCAGLCDTC